MSGLVENQKMSTSVQNAKVRTGIKIESRWTPTGKKKRNNGYLYQEYKCSCGTVKYVLRSHVESGRSKSCGCIRKDILTGRNTTHGKSKTPEFTVWQGMISRCENKNNNHYSNYGGRGISVCGEWHDFETFIRDMMRRPTPQHTIDRKDNNGNYCKDNCKWSTKKEQARNRRAQKRNKTGEVGIYANGSKYRARITVDNGKEIHLGYFKTLQDAQHAREIAKIKYWGR